jgi:DNA-binding NtrC family response regulator
MSLSKNYLELLEKAKKLSKTNLDVLIIGENGVGKHWLLQMSPKKI